MLVNCNFDSHQLSNSYTERDDVSLIGSDEKETEGKSGLSCCCSCIIM
ncbi:MAG: hypothetical protein RCG15_08645 [Candidatus Rickettsia vulgarisii]